MSTWSLMRSEDVDPNNRPHTIPYLIKKIPEGLAIPRCYLQGTKATASRPHVILTRPMPTLMLPPALASPLCQEDSQEPRGTPVLIPRPLQTLAPSRVHSLNQSNKTICMRGAVTAAAHATTRRRVSGTYCFTF